MFYCRLPILQFFGYHCTPNLISVYVEKTKRWFLKNNQYLNKKRRSHFFNFWRPLTTVNDDPIIIMTVHSFKTNGVVHCDPSFLENERQHVFSHRTINNPTQTHLKNFPFKKEKCSLTTQTQWRVINHFCVFEMVFFTIYQHQTWFCTNFGFSKSANKIYNEIAISKDKGGGYRPPLPTHNCSTFF